MDHKSRYATLDDSTRTPDVASEPRHALPAPTAVAAPREVKFHSVETVAAMLGLVPAEVRALIRDGDLPARQVGAHWFVTADRLGAFMSQTTDRARCPRFKAGEPVVFLTDKLQVLPGVYVDDTADGRVIVERRGFFGDYREAFNARQVQPLTARLPAAQVQ
jgi:hypothetical protein